MPPVARVGVQLPLKLLQTDGASNQGKFLVPQMHVKLPDALHRESVVILQVDNAALGANRSGIRYGSGLIAHRTGGLLLFGSPCGILLQLLRCQKALHLDQIGNALGAARHSSRRSKPPSSFVKISFNPAGPWSHPAVRAALVVP